MIPRAGALLLATSLGAGLATGLARFPDPVAVRIALVGAALVDRRPGTVALAAAGIGGHLIGSHAAQADRTACARMLPLGEDTLRLRTVDPVARSGRVIPLGRGCHGAVRAFWPRDAELPAGVTATVRARWVPRPGRLARADGILVIRRVVATSGAPDFLDRSRTVVHRRVATLFGPRAGLVDALVTGRSGAIEADLRERFAASGLVHILSISGFHMSLLGFWTLLLLGLVGVPPRHAQHLAALLVLAYAAWLGWPPPATRAAALFAVVAVGRHRQRALRPDGVLGASALVVLALDPLAVVDLGAWLSFAAMAGLLWATRWYRRQVAEPNVVIEGLAASVGASLVTAPIAALTIGRVAAVGPLVNLVAIPIAAALMPCLFAALLLAPVVPPVGEAFTAITTVLLAALDRVALFGATLPGAAGSASPGWRAALPWLVLLGLAWQALAGNASPREAIRRMGWGAVIFAWWPLATGMAVRVPGRDELAVHFLDVGQGDAAVIRTPAGRWLLVDAGPVLAGHDAGARVVVPFLRRHGARSVDLLVLSHGHQDHVGGAAAVLSVIPVGMVLEPGDPVDDERYLALLDTLASRGIRWRPVSAGWRVVVDGVAITVLGPPRAASHRTGDLNEDSVVLLVEYREFSVLFTGDAGMVTEPAWGAEPIAADLLKVGHHGSATATSSGLLAALEARAAVISLGRNRYGHPAPATLARLRAAGVPVWRTDREGTVTVTSDGRTFRVRGGRTTAEFDARDPTPENAPCCTPRR